MTNANLTANYSISSKDLGKDKKSSEKSTSTSRTVESDPDMFGQNLTSRRQEGNGEGDKKSGLGRLFNFLSSSPAK